jgi:hypothetical protein
MINIKDIKQKVSPIEIYSRLIPGLTEEHIKGNGRKGKHISSPLSNDSNPSLHLREGRNGDVRYKCFSTGAEGDAFDLYKRVKGIARLPEVLSAINEEFNLGLNGTTKQSAAGKDWGATYYDEITPDLEAWCRRFRIDPATMSRFGVKQLKEAWYMSDGQKRKFQIEQQSRFALNVAQRGLKIYQPALEGRQEKAVYRTSSWGDADIFGLAQLPAKKVEVLLILEGEKDVLCAASHGFHAVCFQSANIQPTKVQMRKLREKACEIVICYDNDHAGQAAAKRISGAYDVPICKIPKEEYNDVSDYLPMNDGHAKDFENAVKIAWQKFRGDKGLLLVERFGTYRRPKRGKEDAGLDWDILTPVTNFRMTVEAFIRSDQESKRLVSLVNEKGEKVTEAISTDVFVSLEAFKKFLGKKGNFFFWGNSYDLSVLQRMTFELSDNADEITEWGYQEKHDVWVFGNGVIKSGKFLQTDSSGMLDGMLIPWCAEANKRSEAYAVVREFQFKESELTAEDWFAALRDCYGVSHAIMGAAFVIAATNYDYIFDEHSCFPELMPWGQRGSGKNSYVRFLFSPFGRVKTYVSLPNATQSSISRSMQQAYNIPVWFDEFGKGMKEFVEHTLKGAYDGRSRSTGQKDMTNTTKNNMVTRPLIISGQELPQDNEALMSRMVLLQFTQKKDDPAMIDTYNQWSLKLDKGVGKAFLQIIGYRDEIRKLYPNRYHEIAEAFSAKFSEKSILPDARLIQNYAMLVTPLVIAVEAGSSILGPSTSIADVVAIVLDHAFDLMRDQANMEASVDEVSVFWQYFIEMIEAGVLTEEFHYNLGHHRNAGNLLGIRSMALTEFAAYYQRKHRKPFIGDTVLLSYIKNREYYAGYDKRLSFRRKREDDCVTPQVRSYEFKFDLLPDFVREFLLPFGGGQG